MRKVCDSSGLLQRVSFLTGEVKTADCGRTTLRGQRAELLAAGKAGICREVYQRNLQKGDPISS